MNLSKHRPEYAKMISMNQSSMVNMSNRDSQKGATLIIVLLILLLVSGIAAVSIRSSNTDLKVATADQVDKVLFQANDAAFIKVEKEDRLKQGASIADLKGFMVSDSVDVGESVVLCVRPKEKYLFNLNELTKVNKDGTLHPDFSDRGYCNPTKPEHYVNEGRVILQMTFIKDKLTPTRERLDLEAKGSSSNDQDINGKGGAKPSCDTFTAYSTAVIPALTNASDSQVQACFKKGYWNPDDTTDDCFKGIGAAFETHVQTYQNVPTGVECL